MRETAVDQLPVAAPTPEIYEQTMARWDERAANTWNKHLSAHLVHRLLPPPGLADHRPRPAPGTPQGHPDRDKAIPRTRIDRLFTDDRNPLRERVLWRMLYETCAHSAEILSLNVPDLDMEFSRALVTEKGGDRAYVHWETPTARLLRARVAAAGAGRARWHPGPRLLAGRTAGPVFLADRHPPPDAAPRR